MRSFLHFPFTRKARRERIIARGLISAHTLDSAAQKAPVLRGLDDGESYRLRCLAAVFLEEKEFFTAGGAVVEDSLEAAVSCQACLPILNLGIDWYDGWSTIIFTPREYRVQNREVDEAGVVREYEDEAAGEVLEAGSVVFSLKDIEEAKRGFNVIIHEMAHKIDGRSGAIDGLPPLSRERREVWKKVFAEALRSFRTGCDGRTGSRTEKKHLLRHFDPYAAEDPAEFFAVLCEYFFERPHFLQSLFPEPYALLRDFFRQDPSGRMRHGKNSPLS